MAGISRQKNVIFLQKNGEGRWGSVGEKYADAGYGSVAIIENYGGEFCRAPVSCGPEVHRQTPPLPCTDSVKRLEFAGGVVLNLAWPRDRQPRLL